MISAVPTPLWDQGLKAARPILPTKLRVNRPGDKLQRVATMLKQKSAGAIYQGLSSYWEHPERVVIGGSPGEHLNGLAGTPPDEVFFQYMMGIDMTHYLPDDILVKVDRASMGISLEAREPLLDHRLVEFAWKLPHHCKVRDGVGKWILKQALYKYVPKELLDRPKKGFGVPMAAWLRGPLRDWAEALIAPERIRREGFLESKYVEKLWRDHVSARDDHQYALWGILMFQSWLERYDAV
jgi:asparagine synthase (glutamine-hydrolysing)